MTFDRLQLVSPAPAQHQTALAKSAIQFRLVRLDKPPRRTSLLDRPPGDPPDAA